ncbi:MAG TPA: hypothetical protein EYG71_02835 [Leucothrix sp.]|nr:hypothetical protein [Leucothrix sp.]
MSSKKKPTLITHNEEEGDLYDLLIEGNERPEGKYNHATWEISTKGEVDTDAALVTSVHEAMHDQLNNSTAYGLILIVIAHLVREKAVDNRHLHNLVNNCRNSHEIFATYTSLLIVSKKKILTDLIKDSYPCYLTFVKQAQFLMPGIEKNHLQYPIINSLIRICFQNPKLPDYLEQDNLLNIAPADCPDERLILLSKYINKERVDLWIKRFIETHDNPSEAKRFIDEPNDLSMIMSEAKGFDEIGQSLSNFIYDTIKTDPDIDFPIMEFDAHLDFLDDLLDYANKLAPMTTALMPLVADKNYDKINAVSMYESEAVIFNENLLPASIISFEDYPIKDWNKLLVKADNEPYLYIISRITEKFVTQFQFSQADKEWLTENYPDFVITISLKQAIGDSQNMLFVILSNPKQMKDLDLKKFPMMANSSLSLTTDINWEPWYDSFAQYCSHTLLFDLSPSIQLERSLSVFDTIHYNSFHLEVDKGEFTFIILIGKGKKMATGVFFIPCSSVMSNLLLEQFAKNNKKYHLLDPTELSDDLNWLLRVQMTRLIDESRFDFKALSTQYAIRGFKNDRFHSFG